MGGFFTLATALAGAGTMGLVLRDAENFLRFFLRRARPWARPCNSGSGGASRLGFESEDRTEPLSSEAGLLLWLCEWLRPLSLQLLQTESSERERPIKRETFPVFAASIKVPQRRLCEWLRFK